MKFDDVKQLPSYFSEEDTEETKKLITSPDAFSMIKLTTSKTFELVQGKDKTSLGDSIDCIVVGIRPLPRNIMRSLGILPLLKYCRPIVRLLMECLLTRLLSILSVQTVLNVD